MSVFVASNGIKVANHGGNWDRTTIHFEGQILGVSPARAMHRELTVNDSDFIALCEFFRQKEDERLGRWRWPEDPEWLVKYIGDHTVVVVRESNFWVHVGRQGEFNHFHFRDARSHGDELSDKAARYKRAAWAFFEAHPEFAPKPWHDAKPGEVWAVSRSDNGHLTNAWVLESGAFMFDDESFIFAADIGSGHRTFPAVTS